MKKYTELDETPTFSIPVTKRKLKQMEIAKELNISKSYLSMILGGQRKCPVELVEKLQSIPGVHKSVNLQTCIVPSKQRVEGSNPSRDSSTFPVIRNPQSFKRGFAGPGQSESRPRRRPRLLVVGKALKWLVAVEPACPLTMSCTCIGLSTPMPK
jgi:hypothetical protein